MPCTSWTSPSTTSTPWGSYALYVVDGEVRALQSFCPHMDGPLFEGTRSGSEITCPWHVWRYDLATGDCVHCPPDSGGETTHLKSLSVEIGPAGNYVLRQG